ncbi:MAG: hypothetical protein WBQ94_26305, partial [Terracidiphilus sp.]
RWTRLPPQGNPIFIDRKLHFAPKTPPEAAFENQALFSGKRRSRIPCANHAKGGFAEYNPLQVALLPRQFLRDDAVTLYLGIPPPNEWEKVAASSAPKGCGNVNEKVIAG